MKSNNLIFIIFLFLVIGIMGIFSLNSQSLKFGILYSTIFSGFIFSILFILRKKELLSQETECDNVNIKKSYNYTDELTSLPNRNKFFQDLSEAKGVVLLDLDDFSIINTIYSKEFGDEFLQKLSAKLLDSKCIDNLYRMGGDEFAFISKTEKDLRSVAECLANVIDNFYILKDNILIQITATISVTYNTPFIETADLALKYGKKNKLNLVIFSNDSGMFEKDKTFMDITMRLKKALKTDNVVPFFQCIKDKNGKTVKYEALMRIKEGEKYILPAVFLDIAKKTKLYPELTLQMIKKTFNYMDGKNIPFSFNLSYDDIINKRSYDFILEEIDNFSNKENIIVELLETEKIENYEQIKVFIDELHKRGVKIAIDDFGSGYSNFVYLEKLNIDIIKIDGTIISNIMSSDNSEFLVRTIVEFCKKNGIISVAEFVSHREIFMLLKELDIDEYQGFYFCKPKENIE